MKSSHEGNHSHHPLQHIRQWWNQKLNTKKLRKVTEALPETVSYPIGVTLTDLQGVSGVGGLFTMPPAGSAGLAMGWNYFDAIDSIMAGVNTIFDDKDYHRIKYLEGVLDILSGAQMLTFTYFPPITAAAGLSAIALAGPAFAFMMLCDLINSAIDFYYPAKELKFKGWLDERIKEVNYVMKNILEFQFKIMKIQNKATSDTQKANHKIMKLQKKIDEYTLKRDQLLNDIATRCRVYLDKLDARKKYQEGQTFVSDKINCIICINCVGDNVDMNINKPPSAVDLAREKEIQKQILESFKTHRLNLIMKGLSFIGMTLLAIAPFTGPAAPFLAAPGLVIVTFVTGYYLYKHREQIKEAVKEIKEHVSILAHSIFNKVHKHKDKCNLKLIFLDENNLSPKFS